MDPALKPTGKNGSFTPYNKRTPELKAGKPTKPKEMRMMPPKLKNAAIDIAEGVSAASKEGFEILTCVGAGAAGGSCNSKLLYNMRGPDYVSAGIGLSLPGSNIGFSASYTLDKQGGQYYNLGVSYGKSFNWGRNGASVTAGWLTQYSEPTANELKSTISGDASGISGGYWLGGGYSSSGTLEFGLFTPGIGGNVGGSQVISKPKD
ncbi:hypothetical protein EHQ27_04480 [Leptospira wolffii]|uniref:hypothetical protein n=1 Tax=Leptospira wolffii TaxID=409998 RepID=UPI0010842C27|nr:hypothetical protein [Leptospira wolffii]TGK58168.1 hypothetical protein EHQ32_12790 [Leptospira wolffii]TGK68846.1 hypothetical protein EHQ35_18660 [Leptospira wolffii]TGK76314.1 hypothetical protein EHQ27_04480 [Leptospira wolffii]TGL27198.1 hypothetical protein EHQ57_16640 [Leptospira wolffii]